MKDKQYSWKLIYTDAISGYAKVWDYNELVDVLNNSMCRYCDLNDLDKHYRLEAGKGIIDFLQNTLLEDAHMINGPLCENLSLCDNEFRIMERVKNADCFDSDDVVTVPDYNISDNTHVNLNPISPEHYKRLSPEPKDVIRSWGLNFNLGSAVKYISRAGHKDDIIQDLKKAQQFIQFEIDYLEGDKKQ